MKLLVDEELASFLLPFVATGYSDHAPDGVVGGLFELVEDGRRRRSSEMMRCTEESLSLLFSNSQATA